MFYHDHRCSPQSARFCNNYYHPICDITATLQEYKPVARARPPSRTPPPISPSEKPDAWRATDAISPPSIYRLLMEINNRANSILTRSNKRTNERIQLGATRALSLSLSLDTTGRSYALILATRGKIKAITPRDRDITRSLNRETAGSNIRERTNRWYYSRWCRYSLYRRWWLLLLLLLCCY